MWGLELVLECGGVRRQQCQPVTCLCMQNQAAAGVAGWGCELATCLIDCASYCVPADAAGAAF